jgi:archaellum component FlaC
MSSDYNHNQNQIILKERNEELKELYVEMENLSQSWSAVSQLIHFQGESLNEIDEEMEKVVENTEAAKINLEKSVNHIRDRLIMVRDIAIVTGGGMLGITGFLLGPLVGMGTVVAGIAGGSAAVVGLHKVNPT